MNLPQAVVIQAALLFGSNEHALHLLGGMDGLAYEFCRDDGRYVLKIAPFPTDDPQKPAQMAEKFAFVHYLAQNGVRVAAPIPSINGSFAEVIQHGGSQYTVSAAVKALGSPGSLGGRGMSAPLIRKWGQVTGQMHALAKGYPAWQRDGKDDPTTLIGDWRGEHRSFADWCQEEDVRAKWNDLYEQLAPLPRCRDCFGLVHNDLHPANFLIHEREITVIDFDVCTYHWFAIDLAIPLFFADWSGPLRKPPLRQEFLSGFLRAFIKGYNQENRLDASWIARLPLFLRHHQILLYIVFSDQWRYNPTFQQASQLSRWRRAILEDLPVIALDFAEFAHELS